MLLLEVVLGGHGERRPALSEALVLAVRVSWWWKVRMMNPNFLI